MPQDNPPLTGDYVETLLFYALLAGALMILSEMLSPVFGLPTWIAFAVKPPVVSICVVLAARAETVATRTAR